MTCHMYVIYSFLCLMMNYYVKVSENWINFLMMYLKVLDVEVVEVNDLFHLLHDDADENFHYDLIQIATLFEAILFDL
jgi:hypothetical protein